MLPRASILLGNLWLTVLIHELGHAMVIRLLGYRLDAISIGLPLKPTFSIALGTKSDATRLFFSPYLWGGACLIPRATKLKNLWHGLAIICAGAIANTVAIGAVCVVRGFGDFTTAIQLFTSEKPVIEFLPAFIVINAAYCIGELIPGIGGDGNRLLRLLTRREL